MNKLSNDEMTEIIDKYSQELLHLCYLYTKDIRTAHEIVQDTFIKVYINYGSFRKDSLEKTWITRIAINECKNYLKSSWKKKVVLTSEFLDQSYEQKPDDYIGNELIDLIQELPTKYKDLIILYYYEELKLREISAILHVTQSTVGSRLKKARILLKEKMKENGIYEKYERLL